MSNQTDLFALSRSLHDAPRRRADRRRALTNAEPLSGQGFDVGRLADALLHERDCALSCHRRATTNLKHAVATHASPDEQKRLAFTLEQADIRLAQNRARLILALTTP